MEDDLLTSKNFLVYMNQGLDYFMDNQKIFSVGGFSIPIKGEKENSIYFTKRADSCGWGTWKERSARSPVRNQPSAVNAAAFASSLS